MRGERCDVCVCSRAPLKTSYSRFTQHISATSAVTGGIYNKNFQHESHGTVIRRGNVNCCFSTNEDKAEDVVGTEEAISLACLHLK